MGKTKDRTAVFKEAGSSRVVASGSWTIVMAIVGAVMLFIYTVFAGDYYGASGDLTYWSVTNGLLSIYVAISAGFGQAFVKYSKESFTRSPEEGKKKSIQQAKINVLIALGCTIVSAILSMFLIFDRITFIIFLGTTFAIQAVYLTHIMTNMMGVYNRFDMGSIVGGLFGVVAAISGFVVIFLRIPSFFLSFVPVLMNGVMLGLGLYLLNKIKTFDIKELFLPSKKYPIEKEHLKKYGTYGVLTTLSSLAALGVLANISLIMVYFTYNFGSSFIDVGPGITAMKITQLMTLIDQFVFIEVAIIFFAGPLNVEIAEAWEKKDHKTIEESINSMGKLGFILALPISVAMMVLSPILLRLFASGSVSDVNSIFTVNLFVQGWITFSMFSFGQAFYGLATIFGAALIGMGLAKKSAFGFGLSAILILLLTPVFILIFSFMGIFIPILGTHFYSLIGAGVATVIGGVVVLLHLAKETKKSFKINYDLKIVPIIITVTLVGFFLFFAPIELLGILFYSILSPLPLGLDIIQWLSLTLSLIIFIFIGLILNMFLLCFTGALGRGDGKLVRGAFDSFKMHGLGVFICKVGLGIYKLNPLNKKRDKRKAEIEVQE